MSTDSYIVYLINTSIALLVDVLTAMHCGWHLPLKMPQMMWYSVDLNELMNVRPGHKAVSVTQRISLCDADNFCFFDPLGINSGRYI